MRLPRLSLATVGFVIFVLAVDFAVVRAAFSDSGRFAISKAVALFLLPMFDILLVALYRLRRRERRTLGGIAFLAAGAVATGLVFASALFATETTLGLYGAIFGPVVRMIVNSLTRHFGNAAMQEESVGLALVIGMETVLPTIFFSVPPLLIALLGGWLGRRLRPHRQADAVVVPKSSGPSLVSLSAR